MWCTTLGYIGLFRRQQVWVCWHWNISIYQLTFPQHGTGCCGLTAPPRCSGEVQAAHYLNVLYRQPVELSYGCWGLSKCRINEVSRLFRGKGNCRDKKLQSSLLNKQCGPLQPTTTEIASRCPAASRHAQRVWSKWPRHETKRPSVELSKEG